MREIYLLVMEKEEIENRDQSKWIALFENFWLSGVWCKDQNNYSSINYSFLSVKYKNEALMNETKPLVTKKIEAENRDKSSYQHFFRKFWLSGSCNPEHSKYFQ